MGTLKLVFYHGLDIDAKPVDGQSSAYRPDHSPYTPIGMCLNVWLLVKYQNIYAPMLKHSISKAHLKERILAVYAPDDIYLGVGCKFVNYSRQKILCIHEKAVRHISGNEFFTGCCSYDGTATVFEKNDKLRERIEGPDTEIKGLAFLENYIALTTRGKTTWILEDFEISKILDDHIQDVKGCEFNQKKLYTWSYDGTVKIYEMFELDHSWELVQSIDLGEIVWTVLFFKGFMCVAMQNGSIAILEKRGYIWERTKTLKVSVSPVYTGSVFLDYIGVVCNRNCLLILDLNFEKVAEIPELNSGCDVFSLSYCEEKKLIVCGSEDGTLTIIKLE